MAEALAAVGLASAIIQFIDFGAKVVTRLSDFSAEVDTVPKTFRLIKVQLPLILNTLQQTKDQTDAQQVNEETVEALKAVIVECTATVQQLDEIYSRKRCRTTTIHLGRNIVKLFLAWQRTRKLPSFRPQLNDISPS